MRRRTVVNVAARRREVVVLLAALVAGWVLVSVGIRPVDAQAVSTRTTYTVTDLGTLGGSFSRAFGINDLGQVVGDSRIRNENGHAFLYEDGKMIDLTDRRLAAHGKTLYAAYDINDRGDVLGESYGGPALYADDAVRDLPDFVLVEDLSESGHVVGLGLPRPCQPPAQSGSTCRHALLYRDGQTQDLGTLGGRYAQTYGVNDRGQVVGVRLSTEGEEHGFVYDENATPAFRDLGKLVEGAINSQAIDINNDGQIVGHSYVGDPRSEENPGNYHAFLYDENVSPATVDIGAQLGDRDSQAKSINELGQVVGFSQGDGQPRAFLYEDGQAKDLTSSLPASSGWERLHYAEDINNQGQIVGTGYRANSNNDRAFLLTPTETSSAAVRAGDTISTDNEDDGATASDPVEAAVTAPASGTISIASTAATETLPEGYSLLGRQLNVSAPAGSADDPVRFVFTLDASVLPPSGDPASVQVFRNGSRVLPCADDSGTALPDPCVSSRNNLPSGDLEVTILTSQASAWNLGVAADEAIVADEVPPTAATIAINGGARSTRSSKVSLTLSAEDPAPGTGVLEMRFSNDAKRWSFWQPYAGSRAGWKLSKGTGTRTVHVEYRDGAGNTTRAKDAIKYVR